MEEQFPREDAPGGKSHHGNVAGVNAVHLRVLPDKPHRTGQIQRTLLLGIGPQAVIDHKALIPEFTESLGYRCALGFTAILECPAGTDQYGTFDVYPLWHRIGDQIGAKVRTIGVAARGIFRVLRNSGDIPLLPEIKRLLVMRVSRNSGNCVPGGRG